MSCSGSAILGEENKGHQVLPPFHPGTPPRLRSINEPTNSLARLWAGRVNCICDLPGRADRSGDAYVHATCLGLGRSYGSSLRRSLAIRGLVSRRLILGGFLPVAKNPRLD